MMFGSDGNDELFRKIQTIEFDLHSGKEARA
jgi:hypothetical protein